MKVKDKHILVIGSRSPWLEVILLKAGAKHVTTLEQHPIECDHERITTLTLEELAIQYLKGTLPLFDGMVTFSSLEHIGLGRYLCTYCNVN